MWSETGAESEYSGELSWRKPLENLTERFLNAQNTRKSRHPFDQKNLMCMAVPLSSDLIVLLAYHGKKKIAAVLPEDLGLATLENWHFSVSDLHQ